jgi:glycosyltransferase involved in cell wall biosynthesis
MLSVGSARLTSAPRVRDQRRLDGLRVLLVAEHLSPTGGTGVHARASTRALERGGAEVQILVARTSTLAGDVPVASVIDGLDEKAVPRAAGEQLARAVRRIRPDVVHVQQLPDGTVTSALAELAPTVFNVHNFVGCASGWKHFRRPGNECYKPHGPGCLVNMAARGCAHTLNPRGRIVGYRRTSAMIEGLRSAHAVVAHSRFVADHLRSNDIQRVQQVPLFLDPLPQPTAVPANGPVLFSGRVTPMKGVGTFVRALARLPYRAEVCGDGWWRTSAERLAARLGVADRVSFHGWLSESALADAYRRAAVVAVPSHWPEPFGLVGIEAMAHGRAVVASSTGGIPEWLRHGETGLLVSPGDPVELARSLGSILENGASAAELGAAGARRVAAEFTADRYIDRITDVYATAMRQRAS